MFRQSVSAQVVACLAVITLIKDCYKNQKSHSKQTIFSHFIGPTGLLNTKILKGIQTFLPMYTV